MRSKYGIHANGWDSNVVIQGSTYLACCHFVVLEMRKGYGFGKADWLGKASCHSYPRLYGLSFVCNFTISRMCTNGYILPLNWDFVFRRNWNDLEVGELFSLLPQLEDTVLVAPRLDKRSLML